MYMCRPRRPLSTSAVQLLLWRKLAVAWLPGWRHRGSSSSHNFGLPRHPFLGLLKDYDCQSQSGSRSRMKSAVLPSRVGAVLPSQALGGAQGPGPSGAVPVRPCGKSCVLDRSCRLCVDRGLTSAHMEAPAVGRSNHSSAPPSSRACRATLQVCVSAGRLVLSTPRCGLKGQGEFRGTTPVVVVAQL